MIPKYRTQLALSDGDAPATIEAARAEVRAWLSEREPLGTDQLATAGERILSAKSRVQVLHEIIGDQEQWAIRYRRQDDREAITWVVDVALARDDTRTVASVAMAAEVAEQRALDIRRRLRPPAIVARLAERFSANAGVEIDPRARTVDGDDVRRFVDWLSSPARALPIVAVSVDVWSELPLLNPDNLQQLVLGIGDVAVFTKRAAFRLTEALTALLGGREEAKLWSVHSGAVRLYWPGLDILSDGASPFSHKLWLPDSGRHPPNLPDQIFGLLSWAAIHRSYDNWTDLRTIERRADQEKLERLSGQLSPAEKNQYDQVRQRLEAELIELRAQLQEAVDALSVARSNAEQAWQSVRDARSANARLEAQLRRHSQVTPQEKPPATAEEAIERAQRSFDTTLLFAADIVIDTRANGAFWFGVLNALHDLCLLEQEGHLTRGHEQIETDLPELLGKYGAPRRSPKHGDTDLRKKSPLELTPVHLRWRLHLKSGPPTESESIYWEPVDVDGTTRYLIGWLGHHAP